MLMLYFVKFLFLLLKVTELKVSLGVQERHYYGSAACYNLI